MGARLVWGIFLLGMVAGGLFPTTAPAGTRRDDREDALYRALAAESRYACVGKVGSSESGSGTLIAPEWVLTAAHLTGSSATFTIEGTTYASASGGITEHDTEDVALIHLSRPVSGVAAAALYDPSFGSELGREGTMVGFGRSGTGLTGDTTAWGTKRAGQNMIDWSGSVWGWSAATVLTDFDSPDGTTSAMGSAKPLDLEICPASGDSGGGLFLEVASETYLAGVVNAMWYRDGTANADYGDGGEFTLVSSVLDWINSVVLIPRPGDANSDGRVDDLDASILAAHWQQSDGATWADADFNADARVDDLDASILAAYWQSGVGETPVPEPGTFVLLATGLLAAGLARATRVARRAPPRCAAR